MDRPSAKAGAWTFVAWAAATAVLTAVVRPLAQAHGFEVARLPLVDALLVAYALAAGGFVALQLRRGRGRASRRLALLAIPPLAFEALDGSAVERFTLDLSGYPLDLAILHWLGNLAFVALLSSLALLLLSRPVEDLSEPAV